MRGRWHLLGICALILLLYCPIDGCFSLNLEGLALLEFRSKVEIDPYGAFESWDAENDNPCRWLSVRCSDGKVEALYLSELSLGGTLAPELGKLSHLRSLVLHGNNFTGHIPKEIGDLTMLELLNLRGNNLSGPIPQELGEMSSIKCLQALLCDNKFQGGLPFWIEKHGMICDLNYDSDLSCEMASKIGCTNRKLGHCIWHRCLQQLKKAYSLMIPLKRKILHYFYILPLFKFIGDSSLDHGEMKHGDSLMTNFAESSITHNKHVVNTVPRRRLQESSSNLPAIPVSSSPPPQEVSVPSTGSGSFPAVPSSNNKPKEPSPPTMPTNPPDSFPSDQSPDNSVSKKRLGIWVYLLIALGAAFLLAIAAAVLWICCCKKGAAIGPWRTGISGQLQKAFVTGVPKLSRSELEAACEDFSNIITSFQYCTLFKGTLSSGVEIAVVSSRIKSAVEWSEHLELRFRKKIDTLSRVNHKNFVNLLGYCEENEPFTRMMVFEYSPNGTLFDHLHVKDYEHLDWTARMRVIMGIAYCLQYMHHDLTPPISLSDLHSTAVFITDDFAAKVVDISMHHEAAGAKTVTGDDGKNVSRLTDSDPKSNVYSFGVLILEIISGRVPYSEQGSIIDWGANFLNDERNFSSMVDPTLKSSNENELEIICEIICDCLHREPRKRPTMKEVTSGLKEVLGISPESAMPKLSPLWWAELEILSVEAS